MTGTQCVSCKHYKITSPATCEAFPEGIPGEIYLNKHSHLTPYPGDNGILFEISDEDKALRIKYGVPLPGSYLPAQ
jgi:hypothetical protein